MEQSGKSGTKGSGGAKDVTQKTVRRENHWVG